MINFKSQKDRKIFFKTTGKNCMRMFNTVQWHSSMEMNDTLLDHQFLVKIFQFNVQ